MFGDWLQPRGPMRKIKTPSRECFYIGRYRVNLAGVFSIVVRCNLTTDINIEKMFNYRKNEEYFFKNIRSDKLCLTESL